MSLISVVLTGKFTSVLSDGRICTANASTILNEKFQKFRVYGDHIVGVVGNPGYLDLIESNLKKFNLPVINKNILEQLIVALFETNIKQSDGELALANIVLTGKENGDLYCKVFSNNETGKLPDFTVEHSEDSIKFIILGPNDTKTDGNNILNSMLNSHSSENEVISAQKYLNFKISEDSKYVNNNTFNAVIRQVN